MRLPGASRDKPLIGAEQTTGLAGGHDCYKKTVWIIEFEKIFLYNLYKIRKEGKVWN